MLLDFHQGWEKEKCMSDLNTAVTLIRTGQREEAQAILKEIIRTDAHNIPAWFWMVETLETNEDKLKVMEVCRKLNPDDSKVQKAYDMLKEVQAAEAGENTEAAGSQTPNSAPVEETNDQGMGKELPAAPFAAVPVIQAAPELFVPPTPEPEPPKEEHMSPAAFAAVPVIAMAAGKLTPPPPPPTASAVEEKPASPPFLAETAVAAAVVSTPAASVPAFEPAPAELPAQKHRRRRSWKWLIPAVLISFLVFLCAGISFIYIRQLFP
jgi:hypothetical protein